MAPVISHSVRAFLLLAVAAAAALPGVPRAENPKTTPSAAVVDAIRTYRHGESRKALNALETHMREISEDAASRAVLADLLIALVESTATDEAKRFALRQLALVGREPHVPRLSSLVPDEVLGEMARYALSRIDSPAAAAALRSHLTSLSGRPLIAVISALGARRDLDAIDDMARLLGSSDPDTSLAAAAALGLIGDERAADTLERTLAVIPAGALRDATVNSLLACAHGIATRNPARALGIYRRLSATGESARTRAAALVGTVAIEGAGAFPVVRAALNDDSPDMRNGALACIRTMPLPEGDDPVAAMFASAEPRWQIRLLSALAARGDHAGRNTALSALDSENGDVRIAAIKAIAVMGDAAAAEVLLSLSRKTDGDERNASRDALRRLPGGDVDGYLISELKAASGDARAEIIDCLSDRGTVSAMPAIRIATSDHDPAVRVSAFNAVGSLGDRTDIDFVLGSIAAEGETKPQTAARKAAEQICGRLGEAACDEPVNAAFSAGNTETRKALMPLMPSVAGDLSLKSVTSAALDESSPDYSLAAVRALGKWPNPAPAPDLLRIADSDRPVKLRALAHRGYVRMAAMSDDRPEADTLAMYRKALAIAPRPEDKRPVLAGMAKLSSLEALRAVESCGDAELLAGETAAAAAEIAIRIRWRHPEKAAETIRASLDHITANDTRKEAVAALSELENYGDFVTAWLVSGPYASEGRQGTDLIDFAFPPEDPEATEVAWRPLRHDYASDTPWRINLRSELKGIAFEKPAKTLAESSGLNIAQADKLVHCAAYLSTNVFSRRNRTVRMLIGSDDGVKAWVNGREIHSSNELRGIVDGSDRTKIKLRKGWNRILLKITQHTGDWGASVSFRVWFDRKVRNLKIDPDYDPNSGGTGAQ